VLGEQHHRTSPARAPIPRWLVIPERGLYTGVAIIGAIGTGKTSACLYPYVEQLFTYRADDSRAEGWRPRPRSERRFSASTSVASSRTTVAATTISKSVSTPATGTNPLHNDLDAYALAYGIATLMTNLFGKGKEPFWQQASTNLVKFVILLHQILDDYVTLFQVYEHVINPDKLAPSSQTGSGASPPGLAASRSTSGEHLMTGAAHHLGVAPRGQWAGDVDRLVPGRRTHLTASVASHIAPMTRRRLRLRTGTLSAPPVAVGRVIGAICDARLREGCVRRPGPVGPRLLPIVLGVPRPGGELRRHQVFPLVDREAARPGGEAPLPVCDDGAELVRR